MTPEPVGIASTRRLAVVATAVRPSSRLRRGNSTLEPESGWVRANFDRFMAMCRFDALDGLRAVSVILVYWHTRRAPRPLFRAPHCSACWGWSSSSRSVDS